MRASEFSESIFDAWKSAQQLKATQALRQRGTSDRAEKAAAGEPQPDYTTGEILPDPRHVLMVTMPNGGRYYKDVQSIWYNEDNLRIPTASTQALERQIELDLYKQVPDPRLPFEPVKPGRRVSRRRGT